MGKFFCLVVKIKKNEDKKNPISKITPPTDIKNGPSGITSKFKILKKIFMDSILSFFI